MCEHNSIKDSNTRLTIDKFCCYVNVAFFAEGKDMQYTRNIPSIHGWMTEPLKQSTWSSGTSFVATIKKQATTIMRKKKSASDPSETMNHFEKQSMFSMEGSKSSAPQIFGTKQTPPPGSSSAGESECGTSSHGRSSGWVLPSPLGTAFSSLPRRITEEKLHQ